MAAALLHEPELLFLDEPTSGADPLARREFWRRITALAAQGVTVMVTTHFMEEAEYCDRVAIMDAGRVLAQGTPAEIRARARSDQRREPTWKTRLSRIVEASRAEETLRARRRGESPMFGTGQNSVWLGQAASHRLSDPQGDAPDRARSEQHRHRHCLAGHVDSAIRLRLVAGRD